MKKGQSMAEFALILGVFLFILLGTFEWGMFIYSVSGVSNAARGTARKIVVLENLTNVTTAAKAEIFNQSGPLPVLVRNKIAESTSVHLSSATKPEYITIRITDLPYKPITGFNVFLPKTISTEATMRYERNE